MYFVADPRVYYCCSFRSFCPTLNILYFSKPPAGGEREIYIALVDGIILVTRMNRSRLRLKAVEVGLPKSPEIPSSTSGGSSSGEGPSLRKLTSTLGHYRHAARGSPSKRGVSPQEAPRPVETLPAREAFSLGRFQCTNKYRYFLNFLKSLSLLYITELCKTKINNIKW